MNETAKLVDCGTYRNYKYYIMSYEKRKQAYIEIPRDDELFQKFITNNFFDIKGEYQFSCKTLYTGDTLLVGWFLGWNYEEILLNADNCVFTVDWDLDEILKDILSACNQLSILNGGNENG